MVNAFLSLSVLTLLILPVAVINPHMLFKGEKISRTTGGLIFSGLTLLFFVLAGFSAMKQNGKAVLSNSVTNPSASASATIFITATPVIKKVTSSVTVTAAGESALVTGIIDGDTIRILSGEKVRYIGIDTPEVVDPRKPVGCFGHEASRKNQELVLGKTVRLEKDISQRDRYGRLLRYVYVGKELINETLVKEGYAYSVSFPPDIKYQHIFKDAQTLAMSGKKGLWGSVCDNKRLSSPTPKPTAGKKIK